jgi:hypothetical protein
MKLIPSRDVSPEQQQAARRATDAHYAKKTRLSDAIAAEDSQPKLTDEHRIHRCLMYIFSSCFFAKSTLQCPVYTLWCHFALGPSYFKVLLILCHAEPFVLCIDCSPEMHDELMPRVLAVLSAQAYWTHIVIQELLCLSDCAVIGNRCRHPLLSQVLVTHVHYIMLCTSEP